MNGRFWRRCDEIALTQRRKQDVETQNRRLGSDHLRIGGHATGVGEPLRRPFGRVRMIDVRAVRRGVWRKVPMDEAMGVSPGRPPVDVLRWQQRSEQNAH
jgi:hypothetical protein